MKIAISADGKELSDSVSELFGRCPYFIVAEVEKGKITKTGALKNEGKDQASGAGMSAAKLLAENGVDAVIARTVGPRAADVLKQFGIEVFEASGQVGKVLRDFIKKHGSK